MKKVSTLKPAVMQQGLPAPSFGVPGQGSAEPTQGTVAGWTHLASGGPAVNVVTTEVIGNGANVATPSHGVATHCPNESPHSASVVHGPNALAEETPPQYF